MIKTVLFDVDDTIIDWQKSACICFQRLSQKGGWGLGAEAIYEVFHSTTRPLWEKVEKGELTGAEVRKMRWPLIFKNLGIEVDGAENYEEVFSEQVRTAAVAIEGAGEVLQRLSKKYTLGIASNAYLKQQSERLELLGFKKYFTHFFASMDIGFEKPHREFFEYCLKKMGSPDPASVIMVGDNPIADADGAKKAGLKSCFFNKRAQSTDAVNADYIINELKELLDIL